MTKIATDRILNRDLSRAAVKDYRERAAPVLASVVDEGIAVFERCSSSANGYDENLGVLFPALHVFEMLDGVDILLREAAVVPSRPLLRSAFETKLSVEYVTQQDTKRRGAAYVVVDIHRRIRAYRRYDGTSVASKELMAEFRKDKVGSSIQLPTEPEAEKKVQALTKLFAKAHLKEAAEEHERLTGIGRKNPPFYSFWGGPTDVQQLARRLGRGAQYEILYRTWSLTAHGTDLGRQLTQEDGVAAIRVFRDPEDIATTYSLAISFGLETMRALLTYYRPDELEGSFARWYLGFVTK